MSLIEEWLRKLGTFFFIIEYYSAIQKYNYQVNEWNWKKMILSEITQTLKTNKVCVHLDVDISC